MLKQGGVTNEVALSLSLYLKKSTFALFKIETYIKYNYAGD